MELLFLRPVGIAFADGAKPVTILIFASPTLIGPGNVGLRRMLIFGTTVPLAQEIGQAHFEPRNHVPGNISTDGQHLEPNKTTYYNVIMSYHWRNCISNEQFCVSSLIRSSFCF